MAFAGTVETVASGTSTSASCVTSSLAWEVGDVIVATFSAQHAEASPIEPTSVVASDSGLSFELISPTTGGSDVRVGKAREY